MEYEGFLRIINKRELCNNKLVTDNKGDTKQLRIRTDLLISKVNEEMVKVCER